MMRSHHQYVSLRNDRTDYTINDYIMSQRRITHIKSVTKKKLFRGGGFSHPFPLPLPVFRALAPSSGNVVKCFVH